MKKLAILIGILLFSIASLSAAITFPIQVTVTWTPNDAVDNVTSYLLTVNNAAPVTVPPSACTATLCTFKITIAAPANTVSLQAQNMWGVNDPVSVTFTAQAPGNSKNIKISYP